MKKEYLHWSKIPYAGEKNPPSNPVTPLAGSWPLVYLKREKDGSFLDPEGNKVTLPITDPSLINFDKELHVVRKTLKTLSSKQKKIATYYGTGAPTKQWTPIIDKLIDAYGVSATHAARILATVQGAINDTMIVVWDLKYRWDVARPNQYDQKLSTLLCTPRFPTYPSGHATMSGCAEVVLSYFFPSEAKKLHKIANDDSVGRLYAGVHFPSDNDQGLRLGRFIGETIVKDLKKQKDSSLNPVDFPYKEYRNADIFPENYQQFLPYDFRDSCTSLLIDEENPHQSTVNNKEAPKPFIFI
ncbi:hypothetical protein GCM10011351_07100 [Paraliobacillus quinghaiensis]|uniref:Phosphatidic acid phosphatase type 2/haloperoxidase domain-containing protein n=1 Tax=Paraliobacillus quinghaiensis TaxID=470815 RepID=A0A917THT4_9BACI|nr:vanadium-dependent haloperoxidase [Paraliobacillus quinghaiensis]GGM23890.1 hypothetical protein GCM10011351_07100 [Paraliobacillus quinghaiensis]